MYYCHSQVSSAIWKVDPCHKYSKSCYIQHVHNVLFSVYFEPVTWDQWTVGFKNVPGGKGNEHRSVLSYHFYEPPDVG